MNRLLLLSHPEGTKSAASDLNNLESDSGKITLSVSRSTETGNQNLIVLVDEGHATISGDISGDSLVVLLQLNSDALSDGGVGLFGLDGNLFDNDSCCVGSLSERFLPLGAGV